MNAQAPADSLDLDAPPGICVCSLCRRYSYKDEYNVLQQGRPRPHKTIKQHKLNDQLVAKKKAIQAVVLGDSVLLATAGLLPTTNHDTPSRTNEVKSFAMQLTAQYC